MCVIKDLPLYLGREGRGKERAGGERGGREGEGERGGIVDDSGRWILCSRHREGGGYRYTWDITCKQVIQY